MSEISRDYKSETPRAAASAGAEQWAGGTPVGSSRQVKARVAFRCPETLAVTAIKKQLENSHFPTAFPFIEQHQKC